MGTLIAAVLVLGVLGSMCAIGSYAERHPRS
jgi:hypothetical protein